MRRRLVRALGLLLAVPLGLAPVVLAETTPAAAPSFPFVIPWDDVAAGTAVDVSGLDPGEAGQNGRIVAHGAVFVEEKTGRRVRFLATNLGARAAFPAREDADRIAARMARLGINLVRLHHLQNGWEKDGGTIWKPGKPFLEVDPRQVDVLDFLIAVLKRHGIYTNLNLTTTREYLPEHGFPPSVREIPFTHHKKVDTFDRRMIELQKEYARALLDHVNPYTGLAYRDEPALAFVEINNENSLVGWPHESAGQGLDGLPQPFHGEIVALWNAWLAGRYGDDAVLARAWSGATTPLGPDLLPPGTPWVFENQARREAASSQTVPGAAGATGGIRIVVKESLGGEWLAEGLLGPLTLEEGTSYTLTFRARADRDRAIGLKVHLDRPDWRDHGLVSQAKLGTSWREYAYGFTATSPVPGRSRVAFMAGGAPAAVEIDAVRLRKGLAPWTPPPGQSLVRRNLGLATDASSGRRALDWKQFLLETEKAFAEEMRAFLRDDLGLRASIIDSQVQWGGLTALERESSMEFADAHAYWAHPEFHGKGWDPVNWTVRREAHVDVLDRGQGVLADLALHRVAGKPYTVSEYNHPAPNDLRAEMMPLAMAVAGMQDWDALYTFAYPPTGKGETNDAIDGFFDTGLDVTKAAFYPSTAVQFRRGLVPPLAAEERLAFAPRPWERLKNAPEAWAALGGGPDILKARVSVGIADVTKDERRTSGAAGTPSFLRRNARGVVWGVDAPAYKAVAGFVGGETVALGETRLVFPAFGTQAEGFAAATLVDLEGRGLASARRALLTLVGRVENSGMGWNAERTTVGDQWGKGPIQVEGVPCAVSIRLPRRLDVWALDGSGRRREKVEARWSGGVLSFEAGPRWKTVWYELADPSLRASRR